MYCMVKLTSTKDLEFAEDDKIIYVNPDCALKFILNYIREESLTEDEFDLCDENGELLSLYDYQPEVRGTEILKHLETYFVVLIERSEDGAIVQLTPLLSKFNPKRSEYSMKLRRYINPSRRFSYDLKKSRPSLDKSKELMKRSKIM